MPEFKDLGFTEGKGGKEMVFTVRRQGVSSLAGMRIVKDHICPVIENNYSPQTQTVR